MLVFDKDNTVTAPYARDVFPSLRQTWKTTIDEFGANNVAILSNSAGSPDDTDYKQAKQLQEDLGVSVIRHQHKKPKVRKEEEAEENICSHVKINHKFGL